MPYRYQDTIHLMTHFNARRRPLESSADVRTFVVTLKRGPLMHPEFYYVPGRSDDEAKVRAINIAKAREDQIIEVKAD